MLLKKCIFILTILCFFGSLLYTQIPVVENVRFEQRTDGSLLVDIYYDLETTNGLDLEILVEASNDDGQSWDVPCLTLMGDYGEDIKPDFEKHIIWDFYKDNPDISGNGFKIRVTAHAMICGQTITEDFTLTKDLFCPGNISPFINIAGSDFTFDLGGYTINGVESQGSFECIIVTNVENVYVKNGTINGFIGAVIVENSNNLYFEDLYIKNLEIDDPYLFVMAFAIINSTDVKVKNSIFEFLPVHHKCGINMGNSNIQVDNLSITGGGTGIDFGGDMNPDFLPSSGTVTNSTFDGLATAGILCHYADNVTIEKNIFRNGASIYTDPGILGGVRNLLIKENDISGSDIGILFHGTTSSRIYNNTISNCLSIGIAILPNVDCGNPDIECFYSTSNEIKNNEVTGHIIDLKHDDLCIGNIWENNIFETAHGDEIFTAPPSTANKGLLHVDSIALGLTPDIELVGLKTGRSDSIGQADSWQYLYRSDSLDDHFEFWYQDGKIMQRDTVTFNLADNFEALTNPWIDSSDALEMADSLGAQEFKDSFDIVNIEMSLFNMNWYVFMFAQDTSFHTFFDARK